MVQELRGLGIETMITHWPFMSADSVWREEYEAAGALAINCACLCSSHLLVPSRHDISRDAGTSGEADVFWEYLQNGSLIMPFTAASRNLTFGHWMNGYGSHGVRAVWLDETEPDRASFSYGSWNCV